MPTGKYKVGSVSYHWKDTSRKELYTEDPDDFRQLMVQLWYPAKKDTKGKKMTYFADYNELKPLSTKIKFWKEYLYNNKETHSIIRATIAEDQGTFPVILFSHGLGSNRFFSTFQFEELASHGFIVASVQHTFFSNSGTLFADGTKLLKNISIPADYQEAGLLIRDIWSKDSSFVLDQIIKLHDMDPEGIFVNKIDKSNVGIMGHSFGGANAAYVLYADNRFKAGINLDGFPYGAEPISQGLKQPFMWMHTERLSLLEHSKEYLEQEIETAKRTGQSVERILSYPKEYRMRMNNILSNGGYDITIKNTNHNSFIDNLNPSNVTDQIKQNHLLINKYTVAFFNKYLKKQDNNILDKIDNNQIEIKIIEEK
ncbi:hypothetical protein GCM10010912_68730 [Paenibacillus albidus]|uniref:Platelet-activating factor acetylhydrolase plasma/intracellular n=2 Tax=Paenibacillus albidus TaxID=2041023 RepID=A0A917FYR4_9BACL|nr:hypothetical protein GCM10010912_68730 [Paenibacillus albidus]